MTVFWDDVIVLSMIVSVDDLLFFLKKEHNYCNVFYLGHELLKNYIIHVLLKNNSALISVFLLLFFFFFFFLHVKHLEVCNIWTTLQPQSYNQKVSKT